MAILNLGTNAKDYSKYDPDLDVIHVYGSVDTAYQNQTCTVTLSRNDVYGLLATHTIPGIGASFYTEFDLNSSEMEDSDGINRCVQGDYTIKATLADSNSAQLGISVSIVSVSELRNRWLYGLTTLSSEIVMPRQQPTLMPVTITFTSPAFVKDEYDLVYRTTPVPSLSFAGGIPQVVNLNSGLQDLVLLDAKGSDYVQVRVNTFLMPAQDTLETLVMDQAQLRDEDFIRHARLATSWLESKLGWWVEPHLVISEKLKAQFPKYEYIRDGASFYDDFNASRGVFPDISLPFQWILSIKKLQGFYNKQQVLTVPDVWIQNGAFQQGNIELVPTSGQASALVWSSFPFAFATMQTRVVPAFWQYACVAGMPDLHRDKEIIREAVAKKAGVDLALFAANAYKAGVTSESTSRDNISISRSYSTSAMYSVFAHITLPWIDWLNDNVKVIKARHGGLPIITPV